MVASAAIGAGISAIGGLASSMLSSRGSKGQQARAYNYARQLQQQQYDLGILGLKEGSSATREGLEKAGYNPMLALGNVGNGVSVAGGSPVGANATDVSGIRDAANNAAMVLNQTKQTEATTDAQYALADKTKAEKATIVERLPYVSKQAKADYMKTAMESAKLENDIHYQDEMVNYYQKSLDNARKIAEIHAGAQKYGADKAYNASTYASNVNRQNNISSNQVSTNRISGLGFSMDAKRASYYLRNRFK